MTSVLLNSRACGVVTRDYHCISKFKKSDEKQLATFTLSSQGIQFSLKTAIMVVYYAL